MCFLIQLQKKSEDHYSLFHCSPFSTENIILPPFQTTRLLLTFEDIFKLKIIKNYETINISMNNIF